MPYFGMRSTTDMVSGERPLAWRLGIMDLYPNANPLLNVITRAKKRKKNSVEYNWWERTYPARETAVTATDVPGALAAGTADTVSVTAGTAKMFVAGDLVENVTKGEQVLVTADPTTDAALAIKRGWGASGSQAAWAEADILRKIAPAHEEGASVPTAVAYEPTKKSNYMEIFRNSTDNTNTALNEELRTGELRKRAQKEALLLHLTEMERAFIEGVPAEEVVSGKVRRSTGGIKHFAGKQTNFSGAITLAGWRTYVYGIMEDGSTEKMWFGGATAMAAFETMFEANSTHFRDVPDTDSFGIAFKRWHGAGGVILFAENKDWTKSAHYDDWAIVTDIDKLEYCYSRDTQWLKNRQNPGDDRNIGEYLTEAGIEVHHGATCHGVMKNVTAFSSP